MGDIMNAQEAKKLAQEKLVAVQALLNEVAALADEHRFSVSLNLNPFYEKDNIHDVDYLPRNITEEEIKSLYSFDYNGLFWCGILSDCMPGGVWLSSSEYGEC